MLVGKYNKCPWRQRPHSNLAYAVYSDGSYCYSCNKGVFKDRPFVQGVSLNTNLNCSNVKLPSNYTNNLADFPNYLINWLYSYYIYNNGIERHYILYCPYDEFTTTNGVTFEGESLIFPIVTDSTIIGYQRRFFPTKKFFSCGLKDIICEFKYSMTSDTIILVEDYISAIRISNLENSIWLQGVNLSSKLISYVINRYSNILLWLDSDTPGQQAAFKAIKQLNSFIKKEDMKRAFAVRESLTIKNIVTELDPKCYSPNEIKEILNK